ncbi:MAG: hypothetical protein JO264_13875 [Acidisphaera sp.]|nr:hypothetical protein [Acidisphaera sp.]
MAKDSADCFLDEVVFPTVDEFMRAVRDHRRAKLACIVVSSLADYMYEARASLRAGHLRVGDFRNSLATQSRSFGLVRDICDATKHVRLKRSTARMSDISWVRQSETLLATENGHVLTDDDNVPIASWIGVAAVMPDGSQERVDEHVMEALSFLMNAMGRHHRRCDETGPAPAHTELPEGQC